MQITEPYVSYIKNQQWDDYIAHFCNDGLQWWFNMDTPMIMAHMMPIRSLASNKFQPPRIFFMGEAAQQIIPLDSIEKCYSIFMSQGDFEAACAAAGAGVASIWDSGNNYHRYKLWYNRINELLALKDKLPPLARASIYGFKALTELTGHGDIEQALSNYKYMRNWAEEASSMSLRVFYASAASYSLLWMGRLSEAEIALADAAVLCEYPETSLVCKIYFQATMGLFHTITGNPDQGRAVLEEIINFPFFDIFPPPAYFLGYGHLLHALAHCGSPKDVDSISDKIRIRAIPEQNYFHYSYLHFNLGVAHLGVGKPHKALLHSNEAIERGRLSGSPIAEQMPALLHGQALADLERDNALDHFMCWIDKWKEIGFRILEAAGSLEVANIYLKKGMIEKAREYFRAALDPFPDAEDIPLLHRSKNFLYSMKQTLNPDETQINIIPDMESVPVLINTLGELKIRIGSDKVYDRRWKGGHLKLLLQAIIVNGGAKVSSEKLIDMLWPDSDGDKAANSLKVAISRLRRLGCKEGEAPLQWIVLKHKKVSLVKGLCAVDSLVYQNVITTALKNTTDISLLISALELYTDEFLVHDRSEIWIVRHRELLRELYVNGAIKLTQNLLQSKDTEKALPFLLRALEKDHLNEEIYLNLMQSYLRTGYPAKVLQVFNDAKKVLKQELDIKPGDALVSAARKAGLTN